VACNSVILCIDDETLGLQIRKVVLERAGYRVLTALDGASGLNLFNEHPVDAVILDYYMPGMNGGEVAAQMRRTRAQVPILLLSAYIDLPTEVVQSVDFTLMKGDGPAVLMEKLQEMLAAQNANRGTAGESA
jgi:CheY-like chemotaxis protein